MPLTHTKDLFAKALKGKYALGAFNVNNMELLQAIVEACEEEKAPVMLQISKGARQYANPVYLKKLIEAAVSLSNIPIAVHLDHGDTFELCKDCIDEGFTSVMIDASHEPLREERRNLQGRRIRPQAQLRGRRRTGPPGRRAVR